MNKLMAAIIFLALGYFAYTHHAAAPPVVEVAVAPERPKAPEGVYFLTQYFSTRTPRGLVGWTPGQTVYADTAAPSQAGYVAVTDGVRTAQVHRSVLTQDILQADALRFADESFQAEAGTVLADVRAIGDARQLALNVVHAHGVDRANAEIAASSLIGAFNTRLKCGPYAAISAGYGYGYGYGPVPQATFNYYNFYPSDYGSSTGYAVPAVGGSSLAAPASATIANPPHVNLVATEKPRVQAPAISALPAKPATIPPAANGFISHERAIMGQANAD